MRTNAKFMRTTFQGLCFHRKRPWILASTPSGVIELWDFQRNLLIHRYPAGEHDGSVCSVHFHDFEPLFASGGDDQTCLRTFAGHKARVGTVQFHPEYPWIISASDDYTIRIWNWQLFSCVSVLSGHRGVVKSAFFHPREDVILSASADWTIRLWDFTNLRKKNINRASKSPQPNQFNQYKSYDSDVYVAKVFRGYFCGVSWASFHPTRPCFVAGAVTLFVHQWTASGADDMWSWDCYCGRIYNYNVSCVLFHLNFVVSTWDDKAIHVWDTTSSAWTRTLTWNNNEFWVLASHPERDYLAAGHDNGFFVWKLDGERPDFSASGNSLLYSKDQFLHVFNYSTQEDLQLIPIDQKLCFQMLVGILMNSILRIRTAMVDPILFRMGKEALEVR